MAVSVWTSYQQICDANGVPYSGALVNVYAAGTTTPLSLYTDSSLSTAAANPIVCLSDGTHPMRYMATASYKTAVTTSAGAALSSWSKDNIDPGVAVGSGALPVANGGTGSTTAGGARTNLGAAAESTVTAIASDVTTLQGYHSGTSVMPISTGTTAQRPGSPADYNIRGNSTIGAPEIYLGGTWHQVSMASAMGGMTRNLVVQQNSGTPTTQIDVDADAVIVEANNNVAFRLNSVNLTINAATTGANGLEAGSLSLSTWYSVWVIFNPTTGTTAGLLSSSATAPTMPTDYTAKARVGWVRTNSSSQFVRTIQRDRKAQYIVTGSASLPIMISGSSGSVSVPTWTAVSVGSYVPSTAQAIRLVACINNSQMIVAPNNSYGAAGTATNPPPLGANTAGVEQIPGTFTLEGTYPQSIYYAAGVTTQGSLAASGWEDGI
jgi:hypothetical protein